MESWWLEGGTGQPKVISDCAPKRMLLQQQVEVNRMFALQQSVEQMRNRLETLEGLLSQLIQQSKDYVILQTPKQLPKKQRRKELSHES
jgi:preprotein translocase subunit SecD